MKLLQKTFFGTLVVLFMTINSFADCTYELFTVSSTKDTKIIDFVEQLSDECEFSIIITDPYAENFLGKPLNKTHIKNLTIDEVLKIILEENNLTYSLEENMLKISYLTTRVFSIDYILSNRSSIASTDVTLSSSSDSGSSSGSGGAGSNAQSGIIINSSDEVKFWEELDTEFKSILNRPHDSYVADAPIINKNAGLITVTATKSQLDRLEKYLKNLQSKVQLQVLIDVQLLSVTMSEGKTTGIDWKQLYSLQNASLSLGFDESKSAGSTSFISVKAGGSLKEVIKFLKTQGDVVSISNPKVLTLNNQPALITAGTEYFYKIKSTETLSSGTAGSQSASEDVLSVFAGVLLDITPEISDDKTITLKINPSLSETRDDLSVGNTDRTMPPDLNRRQLSSVVTVKDGNRIILGGLINTKNTQRTSKVPILGDIPGISNFFRYEEKTKYVQELVIIIQPHIIDKSKSKISLSDLGYKGLSDDGYE